MKYCIKCFPHPCSCEKDRKNTAIKCPFCGGSGFSVESVLGGTYEACSKGKPYGYDKEYPCRYCRGTGIIGNTK